MKNCFTPPHFGGRFVFVALAMAYFVNAAYAQQLQVCDNVMTVDDYKAAANNIRNYGPGPNYSGATAEIPVIVYVVKTDDGQASNSPNYITETTVDARLVEISAAYSTNSNYTINFIRCGKINFVHNTTIYSNPLMVANYAYSPWAINMYIDNSPGNPSATFPWSPGVNNNIYMKQQYSFPFGSTAHELGHNMGLIHTFGYPAAYNVPTDPLNYTSQPDHPYNPDAIPRELVIRAQDNSQTYKKPNHYGPGFNNPGDPRGGDLIGDTPADCNPDDQIHYPGCAENGCNIAGTYKDYNGMFLNDPNNILGKNIMSYRSCRSEFTDGQLDVVWDTWEDQRMNQFKPLWCGNMDDRVEYKGTSIGLNRVAIEFSQTSLGAGLVAKALTMPNGDFSGILQPNTTGSFTVTKSKVTKFGSNTDFSYTNADWMNGVSTLDLVTILKHINHYEYMDGYDQVAADVNFSNSVTNYDMVLIRKLILGMNSTFPNATQPWRFIRGSVTLNYPQDFDGDHLPTTDNPFQYANLDGSSAHYNMIPDRIGFDAVKLGDVNEGATINGFNGTPPSEGIQYW